MTSFNSRSGSVTGDPSQFTHVYATAGSYVIAATPVTANGLLTTRGKGVIRAL